MKQTCYVLLSGCNKPTTYALPLSRFDRAEIRDELSWRTTQYYDALTNGIASRSLVESLRKSMDGVRRLLEPTVMTREEAEHKLSILATLSCTYECKNGCDCEIKAEVA